MKKILILLVTILAVACSKDDNKINNNSNNNSGGGGNTSTPTVQYDNLNVATQTLTFITLSSTHSDRHNFADDTDLVLSGVKAVGEGVFKGFGEFKSITTNGVENFGKLAFAYCQQVEQITLNGIKNIGLGASQFNASLQTLTITGVENEELKVSQEAFASCAELKTVALPAQTKEIGKNAFFQCRQIAVVKCAAVEPPKVFRGTFPNLISGTQRVLFVPKGSKEKYEAVDNWKSKFSRIEETDF